MPDAHDRVEHWATPDGDRIAVARVDGASPQAPVLTIFLGLEGTVRSSYAQGLMHQARLRGWGAALLIWRSCDGRVPAAPRLYHSGETGDPDFFLRRLVAERPGRPLLCVGVSLGANVLLKWLGERGADVLPEIRAAAAISTPFDLAAGSRFLERGFSRLYVRHFLRTLRQKALAALAVHSTLDIDVERLRRARTFWEFDDVVTAPVHGFADAADYYARSSSIAFLPNVSVPTLLLSARNDPFLPRIVLDRVYAITQHSSQLHFEVTPAGGHVGWVSGPPWAASYFMESHVAKWLDGVR